MELLVKEKAQDPLATRSTSRPIFASVMGYRRSLVDTCKSSSVLVVSTLVAFMYLLCFYLQQIIQRAERADSLGMAGGLG